MTDDQEFLQSLRQTFLEESKELVEQAEHYFLEFENDPEDTGLIEKIFQLYHTLKGGAGGAEYHGLQSFTHSAENLLVAMRKKEVQVSDELIDILMRCNDYLVEIIGQLQDGKADSDQHQDLVAQIEGFLAKSQGHDLGHSKAEPGSVVEGSTEEGQPTKIEGFHLFADDDEEPAAPEESAPGNSAQVDSAVAPAASVAMQPEPAQSEPKPKPKPESKSTQSAKSDKSSGGAKSEEFVKLPMHKIQRIIDQFGEQVILQSVLERFKNNLAENSDKVAETITNLAKITMELQQTCMSLRMFSIQPLFFRMQKIVRDTAKELDKKVRLETSGENVEIDKSVYDALASTVIHLVKNSVDHGIENAEDRVAAGKDPVGTIRIAAKQRSGSFILEISDDGKGLAKDKILAKAIANGLVAEGDELEDQEIFMLIFSDGLSTKEVTTSISGRGVGMSAIKAAVTDLKGTIDISSVEGQGSTVTLQVPLNLSVFNGTVVRVGEDQYILPNTDFVETVNIPKADISHDNIATIKGRPHSITYLDQKLSFTREGTDPVRCGGSAMTLTNPNEFETKCSDDSLLAIVVHAKGKGNALIVDELIAQERIVLKNLGDEVRDTHGISGGTIRGDGNVTLILDVQKFIS